MRGLLIGAKYFAQRIADLAQSGIGAYGVQNARHGVLFAFGGALQSIQRFPYPAAIPPRAESR